MPMKNIHFVEHQAVDCLFDCGNRKEVPGRVNHEAPPFEIRLVIDDNRDTINIVVIVYLFEYLREGLKASKKACVLAGGQFPSS
jgi:hypothetical protein